MKKILLLIITLFLSAQSINSQTVVLDANGVTVKWTGTTVPNPRFVQASPRGTLEWFAIVDNTSKSFITQYAIFGQSNYFTPQGNSIPIPFNNIVTTLVTDMSSDNFNAVNGYYGMFGLDFNQPIGSWDVSNVTAMKNMFRQTPLFNQPIGSWNVSNVTDMGSMFQNSTAFNQSIGSWNVSNVSNMNQMFDRATAFNQPIGSWNVSNVTDMSYMFLRASAFNQPIGSWNVSSVTDMSAMFYENTAFNQPIGSWNVSNVTKMSSMFVRASAFNQNIGSWNVSNVTYLDGMFAGASAFNQNIGSWNVSNVIDMTYMFSGNSTFNQPIGSWNVSNVGDMRYMFKEATAFNQPIGSWNVSNVSLMSEMFAGASAFNQNIGSWNVSNVTQMYSMFSGAQLSTANYDATLIGWATIGPNETPLQQNVEFDGGNSNYCNGEAARNTLISTYSWTITDAGLNCELSTETFDTIGLKLYPNPVLSVLNVKVDINYIYQPYSIVDGLGRVVLNGNLNEVDTAINVEQLSKGVYYLKLSDSNASKFIKE